MKNSCETIRDDYLLCENGRVESRQINWLKNLSEKCRHLNLCKWGGRQKEYKSVCGQNAVRKWANCRNIQMENGSKPTNLLNEKAIGLGEDPTKPINCKSNPICINKFTNEALRAPKGLYCVGPLVGDNFVRFIPGGKRFISILLRESAQYYCNLGALAITNAITAAKYQEND